jgi:hypothetical protein
MVDDRIAVKTLLHKLLVGAKQIMDSVDYWEDRLIDDESGLVAETFLDQLHEEWFESGPVNALCEQVETQARERVSAWHPGWPHLWAHIQRVTGVAIALAEDDGLDPVLAYLVGICHDVAKLDETIANESHEELGALFAGRVLRGHLPNDEIRAIQHAILKEGNGRLADILHDADKLDKIGACGLVRRISTDTHPGWLSTALDRVEDDWDRFPSMRFDLSRDLVASKSAFLEWFLPQAQQAIR